MKSLSGIRPRIRRMVANLSGGRMIWSRLSAAAGKHDRGNGIAAERVLRRHLAQRPNDLDAAAQLGELLVAHERFSDAAAILAPVVRATSGRAASLSPLLSRLLTHGVSEAETLLRCIADSPPYDILTNHIMAERLMAAGQPAAAVERYQRVADTESTSIDHWLFRGVALARLGRADEAEELLRRFLEMHPNHLDAFTQLGQLLIAQGRLAEVVPVLAPFEESPPDRVLPLAPLLFELATRGISRAERLLRRIADHTPYDVLANHIFGKHLSATGRSAEAAEHFRRVATAQSSAADYSLYQGVALTHLGRPIEAAVSLRHFLTLRPNHVDGILSLAQVLIEVGQIDEPAALLGSLMESVPDRVATSGWLLFQLWVRDPGAVESYLHRIAENQASNVQVMFDLAGVAFGASAMKWACTFLAKARQTADSAPLRVCDDLLLPFIPTGGEDADYWVARFRSNLEPLTSSGLHLSRPQDLFVQPPHTALFCYGINTFDLYPRIAKLWQALCPGLDWTAPHCAAPRNPAPDQRIRIGFLTQPTFPLLWGIARELDRSRFEVVLLVLNSFRSAKQTPWVGAVDREVIVPNGSLDEARKAIADEALDVLIHTPYLSWFYLLSHARLAPVQCVLCEPAWTDGVPNLDYYIGWKPAEPAQLDKYYLTSVALMTRPPYWVDRDYTREVAAQRNDFLLPQEAHWYLCPVNPLKIHFNFDHIIMRLLEADPQGIVILLRSESLQMQALIRRLKGVLGPSAHRLHVLPTLPEDRAHALLRLADAVLDGWPIGGMSSSYAAIHAGIPTVTLPADIVFGRWLAAFYEAIGVTDLIANDEAHYVELAVRLANDPQWRQDMSGRIKARNAVLIEDRAAVDELEHFLTAATAASRQGLPPRHWNSGKFVG